MLADGTSRVSLLVTRTTAVTPQATGRRVSYFLKDAQVGVHNNTNPLVTLHFATPLSRVKLVREKTGATLVLELREDVKTAHLTRSGPGQSMVLEVSVPRPTQTYAPPAEVVLAEPVSSEASEPSEASTHSPPASAVGPAP